MASTKQICLLAIVLFVAIQTANSLKCITCNSPLVCDQTQSLTCTAGNDHCLKIKNGKGDKLRDKRCGTVYECQTYKNCYACQDVDDCNASSSVTPCFLVLGIAGAILARFYM